MSRLPYLQPHHGPVREVRHDGQRCGESTRLPTTSPGRYVGYDNGWAISLLAPVIMEFDKSIVDFPNIKRFPGGASNDMNPNLQNSANPLPLMDIKKVVRTIGMGD